MIVHITSELAPLAKAGGLADVLYGLSKELVALGEQVVVVLPKYSLLHLEKIKDLRCVLKKKFHLANHHSFETLFWTGTYENISLLLIDPQAPENAFQRDLIYGAPDDIDRFLLFCFLTLEYFCLHPPSNTTLHLHDWPTAFVAYLYKKHYSERLPPYKVILTVHNILHQGRALPHHLERLGIPVTQELLDPADERLINILKSGLICSDHIVTVSPTYAREITTHAFGYHLNTILAAFPKKLSGILNGIDPNYWNPQRDGALVAHYSPSESIPAIIQAKEKNKVYVQEALKMPLLQGPLVGCITRLDTQKGPHLIAHAMTTVLAQGGQFILLGHAVDPMIHEEFLRLKKQFISNPNFYFYDRFDETLSRQLYAAADFIIVPSLFEPCGLTQMIAMRYCTIPIVRSTGGLADTVHDIASEEVSSEKKVGICFREMDHEQLDTALHRAFHLYQDKKMLHKILKNLTLQDFSWTKSAKEYLRLYR